MVVSDAQPEAGTVRGDPPQSVEGVRAPASPPEIEPPLTVLEPQSGWALLDLKELWRYRELLFFLALRDVKVRYKQTVLGLGWAVAQPLATMAVFALFLGKMAGASAGIEHYPLFVFAGMVAWTFFGNTVTTAANSVVANERLVTKIYFPRLVIPLSTVGVGVFDLVIASGLLAVMALSFGVVPGWSVLLLPLVVLMLGVASAGVGVLLAALIVSQRDFKYVLTFGVQLWMFATPSLYLPADALGPTAQTYLPLNPAYGLVLAFRQAALGGTFDWYAFGVSSGVGVLFAIVGALYFRRVERSFADTI
ncbi:ABC transporter permease [Gemmata sp. G18]|uniref:Transport permease protein n=1 Tax=Gemmata palustris TaxID=2822762 RepID=A0ABS5C095_9BACT|nr:ABC transporter permease [Gemmata palustris]MBP3959328.1 ABC transporter permease [Gemmata palustris]